ENYRLNSPKILDGILRMTEIFEDVFRESKERLYLFLEFLRIGIRDERIIKKIGLQFKKFKDYFSFVIEEGIKEGSFKNIDSHMIAKLLISFSLGTIFQEIFDSSENWEKFSLEGIKFIISTIKKEEK
ncbi:MAG: TetR/AcrR family transcriptional regulator, partial [Dictyoglomaceae bacterium]|nr:TetR/AcrR family transcriptional regulator [Dictyoglomaceae bacterium]